MQNSLNSPTILANYMKFATKFKHIHSVLSDSWPLAENSRKLEWIAQISRISWRVPANHMKFAHLASNLEVNPVNSRKIQRIMWIPHHLHTTPGKLHKIHDICTQPGKLRTFFHIFMHIVVAHTLDVCTHILHNLSIVPYHFIPTPQTVF